jgi:hypothetical protein
MLENWLPTSLFHHPSAKNTLAGEQRHWNARMDSIQMSSHNHRLPNAAITSQLLLLVYLEIVEWVDLFPWNDVRRGNGQEALDIVLGTVMIAALVATSRRWRLGVLFSVVFYATWLGLQVTTFWIPYAFGASERWTKIYAGNFSQTIQWLPRIRNHLPPDANHFVLQLLLIAALVFNSATALHAGKRH